MVMGEVTRGPCRPASPSLQEGALKAGWLKKQRSIMKNWQLRWFVLRSDQLFFYKDEEETKPQVRESIFSPQGRRRTLALNEVQFRDYSPGGPLKYSVQTWPHRLNCGVNI